MPASLLVIQFFLLAGIVSHYKPTLSLRERFLISSLLWSVQLVLVTELLASLKLITFGVLSGYWSLTTVVLALAWYKLRVKLFAQLRSRSSEAWHSSTIFEKGLLVFTGILLASIAAIALIAPPNTWDSMTYHMARVMHWMQNKSVDHYPSHIMRQHYLPPFAEFVLVHLQLLSGTDHWANFVQLGSLAGCLAGVSLITRQLGGGMRAQVLSLFLVVTMPMAILQGSSTQNDLVASFWVVSSVYFLMKILSHSSLSETYIWAGLSVGLATFTKATTYLWLFPFCTAALIYLVFRYKNLLKAVCLASIISISILCLNVSHFFRNHTVYAHVLGGTKEERAMYVNATHTPSGMISNSIRNLVLHLRTPFYYWNRTVSLSVLKVHEWMGITIHDPDITFYSSGNLPFHEDWRTMSEDSSGNLFHFLAFAFCLVVLFSRVRKASYKPIILYAALCMAGFLFFCVYLRWQEWHSRLHLPLFMLITPITACILSIRYKFVFIAMAVAMTVPASCALLFNVNKPVLNPTKSKFKSIFIESREGLYTNKRTGYSNAMHYIATKDMDTEIGLRLGADDGEYLYWIFAPKQRNPTRFQHVHVKNPSGALSDIHSVPNYLLTSLDSASLIHLNQITYQKDTSFGFCHIYHKK